jgi:hypothetical protein
MNMNSLIGTGRTTRMLQEAKRLAESGRAVYVIAATVKDANRLGKQFQELAEKDLGVKFESCSIPNFNWESMKLIGAHPSCVVLVDHFAIEKKYANILNMLHKFDKKF